MRVLFLVSESRWSARARAFTLAARGLRARGHEVLIACESSCPVQVRVAEAEVEHVTLQPDASAAGDTWQLRKTLQDHETEVVFVHSPEELLVATSAIRLARGDGVVIQRVPPFEAVETGRGSRLATKIAPTGLLFSTEADLAAADSSSHRIPSAVAPLSVDPADHERAREITKASLGAPAGARLIVCVHDGTTNHRVLTAMRTLSLLQPRHPDLHLVILGATRLDELRMHGASLGINASVTYAGATESELSIIRAADVGWIAAEGDAGAFAALDFMAFGTALLAERSPLTEHYVADGIAGVLLATADQLTTAAAVAAFLARDQQRLAMGNAGRARLKREFTYDAMIRGFEQAMSGAPQRSPQTVA
ncbi:MAG: glycosyltransferase [Gemmatimonadaceae bacterium]